MSRSCTGRVPTGPPDADAGLTMEAMILAAGEGRRLLPITRDTPKALVDIAGRTGLARVFAALEGAGADHIIVNAHHHGALVEQAARDLAHEGVRVTVSREDLEHAAPLDTGGALAFARESFEAKAPFFLHNADILTDLPLNRVYAAHRGDAKDRLATLVVTRRETSRPLVVDAEGLCARRNRTDGWEVVARHAGGPTTEVGFAGIHVLSPRILRYFRKRGTYSIIDVYVRLAAAGERIACFDATDYAWHDIGTPERLETARQALSDEGRGG